jgi:hypothetical protein
VEFLINNGDVVYQSYFADVGGNTDRWLFGLLDLGDFGKSV